MLKKIIKFIKKHKKKCRSEHRFVGHSIFCQINNIKFIALISLFIVFILINYNLTFAQENTSNYNFTDSLKNFLELIISILSRWRVVLATLAWKFMTNTIVYWEFIWLDKQLFKLRNFSKNIANFTIAFIFIATVFKYIFWKSQNPKEIVKKIFYLIWAWILIQASRFIVWATLDLSTILSASIWSFPNIIIEKDIWIQETLENEKIRIPKTQVLNLWENNWEFFSTIENQVKNTTWYQEKSLWEFIDSIVPSAQNMAWPLIYMWLTVFHFQDYLSRTVSSAWETSTSDLLVTFIIKFWMLFFYTVALIMLLVFNIMRVFYLRWLIIFAPILIILMISSKIWLLWETKNNIENKLKLWAKKWLELIFAPVVYIAYMWITLILLVTIQKMIFSNDIKNFWSDNVKIEWNSIQVLDSKFTLIGDIRDKNKNWITSTLLDIFVMILALALLYWMTYLIAKWWISEVWSKTLWNIKDIEKLALENIPIGWTSIGWIAKWTKNIINNTLWTSYWWWVLDTAIADQEKKIKKFLWMDDEEGLDTKEIQELNKTIISDNRNGFNSTFLKTYKEKITDASFKKTKANFENTNIWINSLNTRLSRKSKWNKLDTNREMLIRALNPQEKYDIEIKKKLWNKKIESLDDLLDAIEQTYSNKPNKIKKIYTQLYKELTWVEPKTPIKNKKEFLITTWK